MRFLTSINLSFILAATAAAGRKAEPGNLEWAQVPDKTANWYREHGEPLPELASDVSVLQGQKNYVVKLPCVGCPFAIQDTSGRMQWEELAQSNSLLLKFDIDDSERTLRLNGRPIPMREPKQVPIKAYQVASNLTNETLENMLRVNMLDPSWQWATKYQQFAMQWEHAVLYTREQGRQWVQFDVIGWTLGNGTDSVKMDQGGQPLVEILLQSDAQTGELTIEDLELVGREDRRQPLRMKCGKLARVKTAYDPNNYDRFGELGTWSRLGNVMFENVLDFWNVTLRKNIGLLLLALLPTVLFLGIRHWCRPRRYEEVDEDAEIALLASNYNDEPPLYADIPTIKIEEYD